jgi:hypothetical protein
MKYAILIDAGFLKRKLGSHSKPLDIGGVHAFLAMNVYRKSTEANQSSS